MHTYYLITNNSQLLHSEPAGTLNFDIHFYFQLHEINEKTPVHIYCADSFSFDFVKMWQKKKSLYTMPSYGT